MGEQVIRVLLVEDDDGIRMAMQRELLAMGFRLEVAPSAEHAQKRVKEADFDVILLDLHLPGIDGISFFRQLREISSDPPQVIILSGETRFDLAVEALRLGAFDYIVKPPNLDILNHQVRQAAADRLLRQELARLKLLLEHRTRAHQPIGQSPAFERMLNMAKMAAPTDVPVLLLGETGSGKEVMANYVHEISHRREGPFVPINCAAIPDTLMESELFGYERGAFSGANKQKAGYFEMAEGGTLFLDEIGEMDLSTQSKLLRAVETGKYFRVGGTRSITSDVRIISATNRDLRAESENGRFRADLFYRLQGFDVHIPSLRERADDIPLLATYFLSSKGEAPRVAERAMEALQRYHWPGNVRELAHVLQKSRILAQGREIGVEHLPAEISSLAPPIAPPVMDAVPLAPVVPLGAPPLFSDEAVEAIDEMTEDNTRPSLEELERQYILKVLDEQEGHQGRTADILQISPRTLYRKLQQYRGEV